MKISFFKSLKTIIRGCILFAVLTMLFTSCDIFSTGDSESSNDTTEQTESSEPKDFTPTENNVRLLGRTITQDGIAVMVHSATGIEFYVSAKKLSVTFIQSSWNMPVRFVAFLNNERIFDDILDESSKEFVIFDSKEVKNGVVRIVKASEWFADAGITKLTTDGDGAISPTTAKNKKIEFIGDSATAGYGVDETDPNQSFNIETEDITKSYAYKAALALDADYSIICASGWGVISGSSDGSEKVTDKLIPDIYSKVGVYDVKVGEVTPGFIDWDFNRFKPDIITILLGANDQSYTRDDSQKCEEFKTGYVNFIKDIRAKNPDAYIMCCSGLAPDDLAGMIQAAVSEYKIQASDNKAGYLHIPLHNGEEEGWGADWHPTDLAYTHAAEFLIPELRKLF